MKPIEVENRTPVSRLLYVAKLIYQLFILLSSAALYFSCLREATLDFNLTRSTFHIMSSTALSAGSSLEEIANALKSYRKIVVDHNRRAIEWFVQDAETQQPPPGKKLEEVASARLRPFTSYLGGDLPD